MVTDKSAVTVENRLRERRLVAGISQQDLAAAAGLTRQAVCSIEAGRYVPGTEVALRLSQVLACRVEDLFRLGEIHAECSVRLWGKGAESETRGAAACVRGQVVAHPLSAGRSMVEGFRGADCLVAPIRDGGQAPAGQARLLVPLEQLETTALLLGCDPSLGIVAEHLARKDPRGRLAWISASSRAALQAISQGAAHVAGSHIRDPLTGMFNVKQAAEALAGTGGLVVGFASWEQGLMVAPGNPHRFGTIEDLARPGITFVNREAGAGSREILDHLLEAAGVPSTAIPGYERTAETHLAVARMVAGGGADAGMGLRAVAVACGLDFVPLLQVDFDLSIPTDHLDHPVVARLLELLNGRSLRADVGSLPGYEVGRMGVVLARVPGCAPAGPPLERAPVRRPRVRTR